MEKEVTIESDIKVFGFWVYLMTDLVIFGVLFAIFIVLRNNTFNGPSGKDLFHLSSVLAETLFLLTSSFTCALATVFLYRKKRQATLLLYAITFLFGIGFLFIEISEFLDFIHQNAGPSRSAFLSSFFALVGTHGFHVACGLLWMVVAMWRIAFYELKTPDVSRIFRLALFWHFLDLVWVFIFTIVYGMSFL